MDDDLFGSRSPLPLCTPLSAHGLQAVTSPSLDHGLQAANSPSLAPATSTSPVHSVAETQILPDAESSVTPFAVGPGPSPVKAPEEVLPTGDSQLVVAPVKAPEEVLLANSHLVVAPVKADEEVDGEADLPMNTYKVDPATRALVQQCNLPSDLDAKTRNTLYQAFGRCMKKA